MRRGKYLVLTFVCMVVMTSVAYAQPIIVDHTSTDITQIPEAWILSAKDQLHIAYGHTSHGSQITTGMSGLVGFMNGLGYPENLYDWNSYGSNGALDLRDTPFSGAEDLGNPNRTAWATATRNYLDQHPEVNVVIWSWCGQVSSASAADIETYLNLMNQLEQYYPDVTFVYMTGHLDGSGPSGNLHLRNQQIREYCLANNKVLYDFADIESYDPDGQVNYMELHADDGCYYDSDGNGSRDRNWATDWQNSHIEGEDWYNCSSAHSEPLNANLKAYAAWWLWARISGWGGAPVPPDPEPTTPPDPEPTTPPDPEPTLPPIPEPTTPPDPEPTLPPELEPTTPAPVPEPGTLALLGLGLFGLVGLKIRKQKKRNHQ